MNAWIGIIGIVIGTFLGGGVSWFNSRFQLRHQAETERKKFILQKMEKIHEFLSNYKHSYRMLTAEMLKRYASEEFEELPELPEIPSEKLKMLVGFYAPELNDSFQDVEKEGETYGTLIGDHLIRSSSKAEQKKSVAFLLHQPGKIGEACEAMQHDVIQLAKSYI